MTRINSILGDKFYEKNCYEYLPLRPGYMNANFVGESANPIYNGIRPPKLQRMAPIPASLDVLAVNQSKLYPGSRHNTARQIIDQYVFDEKKYVNPIVNLRQPDLIVNQASNIARPGTSQINRGERLLTETISTDATEDSLRLQNYKRGLLRLSAEKRAELKDAITQVALSGKVNLQDYSKTRERAFDKEIRDLEALLAVGVDTSKIDAIFGSTATAGSSSGQEVFRGTRSGVNKLPISQEVNEVPKEKIRETLARLKQARAVDPNVPMSSGSIPPQY